MLRLSYFRVQLHSRVSRMCVLCVRGMHLVSLFKCMGIKAKAACSTVCLHTPCTLAGNYIFAKIALSKRKIPTLFIH